MDGDGMSAPCASGRSGRRGRSRRGCNSAPPGAMGGRRTDARGVFRVPTGYDTCNFVSLFYPYLLFSSSFLSPSGPLLSRSRAVAQPPALPRPQLHDGISKPATPSRHVGSQQASRRVGRQDVRTETPVWRGSDRPDGRGVCSSAGPPDHGGGTKEMTCCAG